VTFSLLDVLTRMGDPSGVHWKNAEVAGVNEELEQTWQALTGDSTLTIPIYIQPNNASPYFSMPSQIMAPLRVSYTSGVVDSNGTITYTALTLTSVEELDNWFPTWEQASGVGTPLYWFPIGTTSIAVYPPPFGSITGQIVPHLLVEGVASSGANMSNQFFANTEDTPALQYMHHVLSFKEGTSEFSQTMPEYQAFLKAAGLKNARLKAAMFYRRAMGLQRDETELIPATKTPSLGLRSA
jgi:hypothetical protein